MLFLFLFGLFFLLFALLIEKLLLFVSVRFEDLELSLQYSTVITGNHTYSLRGRAECSAVREGDKVIDGGLIGGVTHFMCNDFEY